MGPLGDDGGDGGGEPRRPYRELAVAMLRTGLVGYGGGPSILPLIRYEAVTRFKWVEDEEFAEIVAIANTLPGPIATKIAAYLGYRLKGSLGATWAVIIHIFPTTIGIVLLLSVLSAFSHSAVVRGMIDAVDPVIAVMLGGMTWDFAAKAKKGVGWILAGVFILIALLLLVVFHVPDAIVVVAFLAYGAAHLTLVAQVRKMLDARGNRPGSGGSQGSGSGKSEPVSRRNRPGSGGSQGSGSGKSEPVSRRNRPGSGGDA